MPDDDSKLRQIYADLAARGRMLIIVDQPATTGALTIAVAQATGIAVACLPGMTMRRIADLYPGNTKTGSLELSVGGGV